MSNGRVGAVRAFVFDLDGTLIDSKMDLVNSVNAMLRETERAELPPDLIASYIGHGAPQLMASTLGQASTEAERNEALAIFLRHYNQQKLDETRPYPGVVQGLQLLADAGIAMAVLTKASAWAPLSFAFTAATASPQKSQTRPGS